MSHEIQKQTSRSVFRNVTYAAFTWVLPLGLSFMATPVIVRSLGNNDYGIYALVLGFTAYSFAFALARAITKYVAEYRISGQTEKIPDVISATSFLSLAVGVVAVVTVFALAGWLVRDVFRIEPQDQQKTITALYIAAGTIFLTMLSQIFSAVLQGIQRFDVYSKIFTANNIILVSGNLVLASLGFGLLALLWWNLAVVGLGCAVFAVAARRLLPEFGIRFRLEAASMKQVARYSAAIILYQVFANALLLFERGWITHKFGSESLTYYVVPMSLGILLFGFVSSLVLVIFPLASELHADREKLLRLYTKATKIVSVLVVFIVASAIVQSGRFLGLWMGPAFAERSSELLIIHMICFGAISIMTVAFQMTEGLGYPQFNSGVTAVTTVVGITLMLLLAADLGTVGVGLARLGGFGVVFGSIFVVERWFFKRVQGRFWAALIGSLALAAGAAALAEYGVSVFTASTWPALLISVFCGGIAYLLVLWLLDFVTADEKLLIRTALTR
jgi:O-antigen/teichoic acid export membrane protein